MSLGKSYYLDYAYSLTREFFAYTNARDEFVQLFTFNVLALFTYPYGSYSHYHFVLNK